MHTSFTTLVESGNRYALIIQGPILGYFVSLCLLFVPPLSVTFMTPIVVKGRGGYKEYMLSNWLIHVGTCVLRWHILQHPTGTTSL